MVRLMAQLPVVKRAKGNSSVPSSSSSKSMAVGEEATIIIVVVEEVSIISSRVEEVAPEAEGIRSSSSSHKISEVEGIQIRIHRVDGVAVVVGISSHTTR